MFGGNKGIFVSRKGIQKVVFVFAFWLVSLSVLYVLSSDYNRRSTIDPAVEKVLSSISTHKNELGCCRFEFYDPDSKNPLGSVAFENLKTDSADLGFFKTAACRAMIIRNLKIDIIGNPLSFASNPKSILANNVSSADTAKDQNLKIDAIGNPLSSVSDSKVISSNNSSSAGTFGNWKKSFLETVALQTADKDDSLRIPWPDFSHLVQIRVSDFQCRFLEGQNIPLTIQSRKVSIEPGKSAEIILQGHVILQTPQAMLESNCVRWDIQNQTFDVQGTYIIHCANQMKKGQGGCFDPALKKIEQRRTFANKGEK
ncbi:MAG: hypothetical protein FJ263_04105 [Planctomycetes bacterium]|nr:hypothetical protein [Planctomycetota bacterium]